MTPAEFRVILKARISWYEKRRDDQDALNGMQCYISAACAGCKDVTPRQFMIFRKAESAKPQTENEWNNALSAWTGGGH